MMTPFTTHMGLPKDFALVTAVFAASPLLFAMQTLMVSRARKNARIPYPHAYATPEQCKASEAAQRFNCTVRANVNSLENFPMFSVWLLVSGTRYPRYSALCGALWLIGRVAYTIGYASGVPKRRTNAVSVLQYPGIVGLALLTVATVLGALSDGKYL